MGTANIHIEGMPFSIATKPSMRLMLTEPLKLQHRELLHERLKMIDVPIAEFSFANLYLFRKTHDYRVVFDSDIFIRGITYDGCSYLMPTSPPDERDIDYLEQLMEGYDFLFPIPEAWLSFFDLNDFAFTFKEGDTDYVYTVRKMSTYKGRRLHKKRNLLKQFVTAYRHEEKPLTRDLLADSVFILNEWQAETGLAEDQTDYGPCLEALNLYDDLILCGGLYYAEGEPAGFIIGEELNDETFLLHFAKARTNFKGVYQYMLNSFSKVLPLRYRYINFEQDLDEEALRVAKSSYVPDIMLKKMRVSLKKKAASPL
jgi:uncharacterized protein